MGVLPKKAFQSAQLAFRLAPTLWRRSLTSTRQSLRRTSSSWIERRAACFLATARLDDLSSGGLNGFFEPAAPRSKRSISPRLGAQSDFTLQSRELLGESGSAFTRQQRVLVANLLSVANLLGKSRNVCYVFYNLPSNLAPSQLGRRRRPKENTLVTFQTQCDVWRNFLRGGPR